MSLLDKIAAAKAANPPAPQLERLDGVRLDLPETSRVAQLPSADYRGADLNPELRLDGATWNLWGLQSEALAAARHADGLLAPIPVGRGKTLVALLVGTVWKAKLALVFTKARIVGQMRRNFEQLRGSFDLAPTRILSYATLSRPKGTALLEELAARYKGRELVLVFDEAHALASTTSARTMRVIRFLRANPEVRVAALSGTLLSRSVEEACHLSELALRERSPFPAGGVFRERSRAHVEAWKETLDPDGRPGPEHWERMKPLAAAFGGDLALRGKARRRSLRAAFSRRLRSAPGVVCGDEKDLGVALQIVPVDLEVPVRLEEAVDHLRATGEAPDGEIVPDDDGFYRKARELSAGFFYRWEWGEAGPDLPWLEARSDWNRCVRAELRKHADTGYDSPLLVSQRIDRETSRQIDEYDDAVPVRAIHRAWWRWIYQKDKPKPPTVPVWLDTYLVDDAVALAEKLAHKGTPPILWYSSSTALEPVLRERLEHVYGAGDEPPDIDSGVPAHLCAASLCHATGRNLQQWRTAIVLEPPSSGKAWEQLLGRLHRERQLADEVVFYVYQHTDSYRNALESAEEKAAFFAESFDSRQRLLYADRAEVLDR